jgi:hypothetical protein
VDAIRIGACSTDRNYGSPVQPYQESAPANSGTALK